MDYYSPTHFLQSPPAIWRSESAFEPLNSISSRGGGHTLFAALPEIDLFAEPKFERAGTFIDARQPVAPIRTSLVDEGSRASSFVDPENFPADEIDTIAKNRVRLLAANYVDGKMSAEIAARLEILDLRMLERAPRVTSQHVEALETANALLDRTQQSRAERRRRLGIGG